MDDLRGLVYVLTHLGYTLSEMTDYGLTVQILKQALSIRRQSQESDINNIPFHCELYQLSQKRPQLLGRLMTHSLPSEGTSILRLVLARCRPVCDGVVPNRA